MYNTSSLFTHLLMDTGCFHVLAIVNRAAINIGVPISFLITVLSGCMPRSGIAGSSDNSVFSFLGKLSSVLNSGCTSLIPTNNVAGFSFLHTLSSVCYL